MTYEKIIKYISEQGITMAKFEKICELANGIVGKWRDGKAKPTLSTIEKIAKATNTSVSSWV